MGEAENRETAAVPEPHKIRVVLTDAAKELAEIGEVTPQQVEDTVRSDRGLFLFATPPRTYSIRWLDGRTAVFVGGVVTKSEQVGDQLRIDEVSVSLVLAIGRSLPAGHLSKDHGADAALDLVARSFGRPVACHAQQPPASLYSGPWDGTVRVLGANGQDVLLTGSFNPDDKRCHHVWAFDARMYRDWAKPPAFRYERIDGYSRDYRRLVLHVKNDGVANVALNFTESIDRVGTLARFPPFATNIARLLHDAVKQSVSPYPPGESGKRDLSPEEQAATLAGVNRIMDEHAAAGSAMAPDAMAAAKASSYEFFDSIWKDEPLAGSESIRALLSTFIVNAWTAFEASATDLWITAVNQRPTTLGVGAILSPKRTIDGEPADDSPATADKPKRNPISLDTLVEYGFNLSGQLGEMLWRRRHFDFNSLEGIKDAFHGTFSVEDSKGGRHYPTEVKGWFKGDGHADLRVVEALRHLLVHRGGRVDKMFLARVKNIHPDFSKLAVDERVPLDGQLVATCIDAVTKRATLLIRGVDQWLTRSEK